jgi:hypothetical protein
VQQISLHAKYYTLHSLECAYAGIREPPYRRLACSTASPVILRSTGQVASIMPRGNLCPYVCGQPILTARPVILWSIGQVAFIMPRGNLFPVCKIPLCSQPILTASPVISRSTGQVAFIMPIGTGNLVHMRSAYLNSQSCDIAVNCG